MFVIIPSNSFFFEKNQRHCADKSSRNPEMSYILKQNQKCGPMPNVMTTLPNIGGALCSTPQSLADAQYWNAVQ